MLYLVDTPHWSSAERRWDLPSTLPGWTIAFLALQCDWIARDRLCTLLWPDANEGDALHSLRVNLYRVRALLNSWGIAQALVAERRRVRLDLPSDVADLRRALQSSCSAAQLAGYRRPLLASMSLAGFPAFQEWLELERATLHTRWREAALACLSAAGTSLEQRLELSQTMLTADPLDEQALAPHLQCLVERGRTGDARRRFEQFRARLMQELGAEPEPALRALAASLDGSTVSRQAPTRDAFIGRELELDQLGSMVGKAEGSVVTVTGPGGVGKSRIARELSLRLAPSWRDGVVWVALADLSIAADALPRLAEQIGLTLAPQRDVAAQLSSALAARRTLIVLDNAEHLSDLPALLTELVRAAPQATWLVTSRAPLTLAGERTYSLEGMAGPESGEVFDNVDQVRGFDAMRLLESRVLALNPEFDLAPQWAAGLELVRLLSGWPLAIELAAGALAQHGVGSVLADLRGSIDALVAGQAPKGARHDSMRASLALSWGLLGARERVALAQLSVFRGGFARPAALAVTQCAGVVLARLLERSLVQVLGNGRFDLHPLVAQFAAEQLAADQSQRAGAERRHGEHYAALLQACAAAPADGIAELLQQIALDFENCRSAWTTLVAHGDTVRLARSARAWSEFGTAKGRTRELAALVAAALSITVADSPARCALLQAVAILHYRGGELDSAQALARDALVAADAIGDAPGQRAMLNTLALALKDLGRYGEAEQCAQEGLSRARAGGVEREIASHANTCAILAKTRGDYAQAAALYDEAIAIHRRGANHRSLATCLNNLGNVHRARGDWAAAQREFEESLRVAEQHGIDSSRAFALVNLGVVHQHQGKPALAQSFARRSRDGPSAEVAVLLAADAVLTLAAIDLCDFAAAGEALRSLAHGARRTGLHAAQLETVNCHAKLLAALGRRDAAIARFVFLLGHPQLPAMQHDDVQQALRRLAPTAAEQARAGASTQAMELDLLIEDADMQRTTVQA
jgi:predicted ATPase/DNA-binding SARP family transcriptional activator